MHQRSVILCKLQAEIRDLADSFLFLAEIVEPSREPEEELRDQADQPVLGTLLEARADYLITGDKDLLALAERYPILTPAAFLGAAWELDIHGRPPQLALRSISVNWELLPDSRLHA